MKMLDPWFSKKKVTFGLYILISPSPSPLPWEEMKLRVLCIPKAGNVYGDKEEGPLMGNAQHFAALGSEKCDIPTTLYMTSGK